VRTGRPTGGWGWHRGLRHGGSLDIFKNALRPHSGPLPEHRQGRFPRCDFPAGLSRDPIRGMGRGHGGTWITMDFPIFSFTTGMVYPEWSES